MVKGLLVNHRVRGSAMKVLGATLAKTLFPQHWKTLFLFGTIVKRHRGRTVSVQWDKIDKPHDCATRMLKREEPDADAAAADAGTAETADNAGNPADNPPPAAAIAPPDSPRESGSDHTTSDDDSEDMVIADMLFDDAEDPGDEDDTASGDEDDADDEELRPLLTAHGLTWTRQDAGVVVDEPLVTNFTNDTMVWNTTGSLKTTSATCIPTAT